VAERKTGLDHFLQNTGFPKKGSVFVTAEHAAMADVFEAVLVDHDRDEIRIDLERSDKGVREFFDNFAFLFRGPAFAHLEYNDGHNSTLT
jgi:hypothetical protein